MTSGIAQAGIERACLRLNRFQKCIVKFRVQGDTYHEIVSRARRNRANEFSQFRESQNLISSLSSISARSEHY